MASQGTCARAERAKADFSSGKFDRRRSWIDITGIQIDRELSEATSKAILTAKAKVVVPGTKYIPKPEPSKLVPVGCLLTM